MTKEENTNSVLPLFELDLRERSVKEHYSLERNSNLQCHWRRCLETFHKTGAKRSEPFKIPHDGDYHFYNGQVMYKPAESISRRSDFKFHSGPGPGFDHIGEKPIPYELFLKRVNTTAAGNQHQPNKSKSAPTSRHHERRDAVVTKSRLIIPRRVKKTIVIGNKSITDAITPSLLRPVSEKRIKTLGHKADNTGCTKTTIQVTEEATVKVNQKEHKIVVQNKCTVAVHNRRKSTFI